MRVRDGTTGVLSNKNGHKWVVWTELYMCDLQSKKTTSLYVSSMTSLLPRGRAVKVSILSVEYSWWKQQTIDLYGKINKQLFD